MLRSAARGPVAAVIFFHARTAAREKKITSAPPLSNKVTYCPTIETNRLVENG